MNQKDIFDRLMELPGLRKYNNFYKKYKEALLYLLFGGLTTLISIFVYASLNIFMGVNELVANIVSWIISVAFAFFTNRILVFSAPTISAADFIKQMGSFYGARILTLIIEEVILFIFITRLGLNSMIIKILAQIIVIVLNYFISKLWIFKK